MVNRPARPREFSAIAIPCWMLVLDKRLHLGCSEKSRLLALGAFMLLSLHGDNCRLPAMHAGFLRGCYAVLEVSFLTLLGSWTMVMGSARLRDFCDLAAGDGQRSTASLLLGGGRRCLGAGLLAFCYLAAGAGQRPTAGLLLPGGRRCLG